MAEGMDEWVGLDEGRCVPMEVYVQVNFKSISTQTYTLSVVGIKGYLCSSIKKIPFFNYFSMFKMFKPSLISFKSPFHTHCKGFQRRTHFNGLRGNLVF